jgi:hypothetical protein
MVVRRAERESDISVLILIRDWLIIFSWEPHIYVQVLMVSHCLKNHQFGSARNHTSRSRLGSLEPRREDLAGDKRLVWSFDWGFLEMSRLGIWCSIFCYLVWGLDHCKGSSERFDNFHFGDVLLKASWQWASSPIFHSLFFTILIKFSSPKNSMHLRSQPYKRRLRSALGSDARRYLNGGGLYDTYLIWKLLFTDGYVLRATLSHVAVYRPSDQYDHCALPFSFSQFMIACIEYLIPLLNFEYSKIVQDCALFVPLFLRPMHNLSSHNFL